MINEKYKITKEGCFIDRSIPYLDIPIFVELQIISHCNLYCRHCYNESGGNELLLSFEDIKKVIDGMYLYQIPYLGITGGEAILHPRIFSVIRYAKRNNLIIALNSNGFSLDENVIRKLSEEGLDKLNISLDGSEDLHNYIRGNRTSYIRAINAIKIAKKYNIDIEVFFTCMNINFDTIPEVISLCKKLHIKLYFMKHHKLGRSKNNEIEGLSIKQTEWILQVTENNSFISLDKCFVGCKSHVNCILCNSSVISITPSGTVGMCPFLKSEHVLLGNLKTEDWNSLMYKRKNHEIFKNRREYGNALCDI